MPSLASIIIDQSNCPHETDPLPYRQQAVPKGDAPFPPATRRAAPKREPHPPLTEEQLQFKEDLRKTLRTGIWCVDFIKVNGMPSTMECTLDPRYLPHSEENINPVAQTTGAASAAEHLLHVYATDRLGWRSFATPNVRKIYQKQEPL